MRATHKYLLTVSIFAYAISLFLPAFNTEYLYWYELGARHAEQGPTWYGFEVIAIGWLGAFLPTRDMTLAWFANPAFWLAASLYYRKNAIALPVAALSIFLAFTSFWAKKLWNDKEPPTYQITELGPGFYIWLLAIGILLVGAWLQKFTISDTTR